MEPNVLVGLIRGAVEAVMDLEAWEKAEEEEEAAKANLKMVAEHWESVTEFLRS